MEKSHLVSLLFPLVFLRNIEVFYSIIIIIFDLNVEPVLQFDLRFSYHTAPFQL